MVFELVIMSITVFSSLPVLTQSKLWQSAIPPMPHLPVVFHSPEPAVRSIKLTTYVTPNASIDLTIVEQPYSQTNTESNSSLGLTPTSTPSPSVKPSATPSPEVLAAIDDLSTPKPTVRPTKSPTPIPTPEPTPKPHLIAPVHLEPFFTKYSEVYNADKQLLIRIAKCESGFNATSKAPAGYSGMFQFGERSWTSVRSEMALDTNPELRFNAEESIRTAAYMVSKGRQNAWPNCN